ncbi:MAG: hypothetical protein J6J23_07135 [Clostridia bacterium]|nr:hypothetical protein [Clostridia bacterium]
MESLLLDLRQLIDNKCFDEDKDFLYVDTRINEEYWKDNIDATQRADLKRLISHIRASIS